MSTSHQSNLCGSDSISSDHVLGCWMFQPTILSAHFLFGFSIIAQVSIYTSMHRIACRASWQVRAKDDGSPARPGVVFFLGFSVPKITANTAPCTRCKGMTRRKCMKIPSQVYTVFGMAMSFCNSLFRPFHQIWSHNLS